MFWPSWPAHISKLCSNKKSGLNPPPPPPPPPPLSAETGVRLFTPRLFTPDFLPPVFLPPDFLPLRLFTPTTFYPHIQFTSTEYSKSKVLHKNIIYIYHNISNYQIVNKQLKEVISYSMQI